MAATTEGSTMQTLNRKFATSHHLINPDSGSRPIRVIQFGEGNFLRAFVDWIIQQLNDNDLFGGNVAIVQPLPQGRVDAIEAQDRLYTVLLEGLKDGQEVCSRTVIDSIGATVNPYTQWDRYLALADDPATDIIVSNTTEAGIALDDADTPALTPPNSYPAKLLQLLKRRYDKGLPGFLIIPCELIAYNGVALHDALVECAPRFGYDDDFAAWIDTENTFASTLVDRIVPGYPRDIADQLWDEFGYRDDNMVKAEPFALWVVAGDKKVTDLVHAKLPANKLGIDIVTPEDVQPYRERKVFLLNGPHTTMALVARLAGFATVGEVMGDATLRRFILDEMHEEIIPVLSLPVAELEDFAAKVVERFDNPFVKHSLDSIGLNSAAKFVPRLLPLVKRNIEQGRGVPQRIALALSGLLAIYGGLVGDKVNVSDAPEVVDTFRRAAGAADCTAEYVHAILSDAALWGEDLTTLDGLEPIVAANVAKITDGGINDLIAPLAK